MGKDKTKEAGGKGKGKQAASGSDENASKGKGKGAKGGDGLGTCTYVKGRNFSSFIGTLVTYVQFLSFLVVQNDIDLWLLILHSKAYLM